MKTERRHELQTNDLADWLGKHIEQYRPLLKYIGGGLVAVVVVSIAYVFLLQQQSAKSGMGWRAFLQASLQMSPDDQAKEFQDVATTFAGTDTALWATLSEADLDLGRGSDLLFSDRELALVELERAKKNFSTVEQKTQRNPLLQARAKYGLAQTLECLGDLSSAREKYQQVQRSAPESTLGKTAEKRAKRLEDNSIGEFYAWFEKQKPRPRSLTGAGGVPPMHMDDLPDRPDFSLPGFDASSTSPLAKPSADLDPASDKPADDKPPAEKPESTSDAEDSKPADPKSDKPTTDDAKPSPPSGDKPPVPGGTELPK